jgi:hypothetical protein
VAFNQLSELTYLEILLVDNFVTTKQVIFLDHVDILVVRNKGFVVVLAQLFNLTVGLTDEEIGLFSVEFLLLVYQCEQEEIVTL